MSILCKCNSCRIARPTQLQWSQSYKPPNKHHSKHYFAHKFEQEQKMKVVTPRQYQEAIARAIELQARRQNDQESLAQDLAEERRMYMLMPARHRAIMQLVTMKMMKKLLVTKKDHKQTRHTKYHAIIIAMTVYWLPNEEDNDYDGDMQTDEDDAI